MNFTFGREQRLFQRTVRDFLEKECTPGHVRAADRSSGLWRGLAGLGVLSLMVPEEHGGLGKDEVDLVLLLEEAGRAAMPEPLLETTVVGAAIVRDFAPAEFGARWLPRIASGEATCRWARGALSLQPESGSSVVVPGSENPAAVDEVLDRGAFGSAAVLCGIADRVIEMAAEYAKQRHQFGKPIGSFQAVKHLLADALLGLEFARPLVYRAAWSMAWGIPERGRDVSMAKHFASETAINACRSALQVHGAIGYTHEHDLHLWLNKGFALAHAWGSAAWHRDRVASAELD